MAILSGMVGWVSTAFSLPNATCPIHLWGEKNTPLGVITLGPRQAHWMRPWLTLVTRLRPSALPYRRIRGNIVHLTTWTGKNALLGGQGDSVPVRLSDYQETRIAIAIVGSLLRFRDHNTRPFPLRPRARSPCFFEGFFLLFRCRTRFQIVGQRIDVRVSLLRDVI